MSVLETQRIFAAAELERDLRKRQYHNPFESYQYFTTDHLAYAWTLTYKASGDPVTVDTMGFKFCAELTQRIIGRNWKRYSKRHLFPFVQGFMEHGRVTGYHHHGALWIHPRTREQFLDCAGTSERIRRHFPFVATSAAVIPTVLVGWIDYASAEGRNADRIILWHPKPAAATQQARLLSDRDSVCVNGS